MKSQRHRWPCPRSFRVREAGRWRRHTNFPFRAAFYTSRLSSEENPYRASCCRSVIERSCFALARVSRAESLRGGRNSCRLRTQVQLDFCLSAGGVPQDETRSSRSSSSALNETNADSQEADRFARADKGFRKEMPQAEARASSAFRSASRSSISPKTSSQRLWQVG